MFSENELKDILYKKGATLVGFADLSTLLDDDLNRGVSIALKLSTNVIKGISDGPTKEYFDTYHSVNQKLNELAHVCAGFLEERGYHSFAQTTDAVREFGVYQTRMPHKTVAACAGLGWIGKSALFVTKEYGSAVRLTSVLTDAPIKAGNPIIKSNCGDCMICKDACPADAISGKLWSKDLFRDDFFDPIACRERARKLAYERIHEEITLCGKCIEVCPYTQKYINRKV